MKYLLHFAHANGLPSASYQLLLDQLSHFYQVHRIEMLGHNPQFPVTNNWVELKKELIHSIEKQCKAPCIGVGHSLGGALTMMAAIERPDLFRSIVILDVPTFTRTESLVVWAAKTFGFIDQLTPAKKSRTRRTQWHSPEEAIEYFKPKRMFSRFHEQCLQDYVDSALEENSEGLFDLGYRLDVELAVYRTIPHSLVLSRSHMKVPMSVLVGKQTDTVRKSQYLRMKNRLGFLGKRVEGSHMFPLEFPIETAKSIHHFIQQMDAK